MIIYTVFDAGEGDEKAFCTKQAAIDYARDCTPGTEVHRVDIGPVYQATCCALYNREGYAQDSALVYTSPDHRKKENP